MQAYGQAIVCAALRIRLYYIRFFPDREEFLLPKTPPLAEQGKTGGSTVEEGGKEAGFRPFFSTILGWDMVS